MSNEVKKYLYIFSDGTKHQMPSKGGEVELYMAKHNVECVYSGYLSKLKTIKPLRGNSHNRNGGFTPGYNPGLGKYIGSYAQHKEELKKRGLEEMGTESQKQKKIDHNPIFDDEVIRELVQESGLDISDNEAEAIKKIKFTD